jgi:hypothetical protein
MNTLVLPSVSIYYNSPETLSADIRDAYPDAHIVSFSYDSIGIDDARDIAALLSGNDQLKIVIVSAHVITSEAQNYFLKPLEELHPQVKIVFAFSGSLTLLPTFVSRGIVSSYNSAQPTDELVETVTRFIQSNLPERFKIIEELLSDEHKNHQSVQVFLQALYKYARDEKIILKNHAVFIHDLPDLLSYASVRGASHKMILEYIACLV